MEQDRERAMLRVIHRIADHFGPEAVVKGGMSLRLYGFSRATQDIDFAFQPHRRKREFSDELVEVVNELMDVPATVASDSKKIRIQGRLEGIEVIVEASPHAAFEPEALTTAAMARGLHLRPQVVSVMPKGLAFAHKLGAWLDRRLIRDLYDCFVYAVYLKAVPDRDTLLKRITHPAYAHGVSPKPALQSISGFGAFLRREVDKLDPATLESSLTGLVGEQELPGLGLQMVAGLRRLRLED